jgi:ureidoglycolate hydrolase
MDEPRLIRIRIEKLSPQSFAPFGMVLGEPPHTPDFAGNRSHSWLTPFAAEGVTQLMYTRFYHQPMRFSVLERHFNVTQGFVPLNGTPFVMVVAPPSPDTGDEAIPAPEALHAFYIDGTAGVLMHKGTWHTLDRYPVQPPHLDCVSLTARSTQLELMQEKADGTPPRLTEVVDYATHCGTVFEAVGAEAFAG